MPLQTPASDFIKSIFPDAKITSTYRGPNHELSKANPNSYHAKTKYAVDLKPINGVSFTEFVEAIKARGVKVFEALNETGKGKSGHATGDHWHIAFDPTTGEGKAVNPLDILGGGGIGLGDIVGNPVTGEGADFSFNPLGVFDSALVSRLVAVVVGVILVGLAIAAFVFLSDGKSAVINMAKAAT